MNKLSRALGVVVLGTGLASCWTPSAPDEDDPDLLPPRRDAGVRDASFIDAGTPIFSALPPPRLSKLIVAERPPPALSGGTLAVSDDGSVAVAADPDRDLIYVVTVAAEDAKTVQLATGSEPGRVVLDGAGRAHVALRGAGALLSLDLTTAEVIKQTPVCTLPRGLAYDKVRDALVVACASGELVTLAAATHQTLSSVEVDVDLRDVVLASDGGVSVSRYRSAELVRLDGEGKPLTKTPPLGLAQERFVFPPQPTFFEDGGSPSEPVSRINTNKVHFSPTLAWKTVALSSGGTLMLHQQSQDDEVGIDADAGLGPLSALLPGGGGGGYGGGCQSITQASLTRYAADGTPTESITLQPRGLAVDIAVSPFGDVAVAWPGAYLQAQASFEVISLKSLQPQPAGGGLLQPLADGGFQFELPTDAGLAAPTCVSGMPGGPDIQASAVAFDASGQLFVFSREPAVLHSYSASLLAVGEVSIDHVVPLSPVSVRDTGHELFHADVGSGLSCAGCHGEALDDGHVWNFRNFGPRRTQTMRGGFLSTLPLHWEGDLPTFKHLVDEVMTRRMGGFTVDGKYADALAQWIDKLPPVTLGGATADAVQRGKLLFESEQVACASCHSGTHFTNNQSVDVGTGGVFQVPTLLGLALHPPFLHDGCAPTLAARFDPSCGGGDKHGKTSQLTASELADLVSYLTTL